MKTQTVFQNTSLVSVVNGSIVIKDSTGGKHTFTNASVVSVNNGTIIIESEWKPKEGELIKIEGNGADCYAIFKANKDSFYIFIYGWKFIGGHRIVCYTHRWCTENATISPVTPKEQKEFDEACKSQGKIWNKETLQWEKYGWRPKQGELYFYVLSSVSGVRACQALWFNTASDYLLYDTHNCFRTEKQAQKAAEKVKELFKSL